MTYMCMCMYVCIMIRPLRSIFNGVRPFCSSLRERRATRPCTGRPTFSPHDDSLLLCVIAFFFLLVLYSGHRSPHVPNVSFTSGKRRGHFSDKPPRAKKPSSRPKVCTFAPFLPARVWGRDRQSHTPAKQRATLHTLGGCSVCWWSV